MLLKVGEARTVETSLLLFLIRKMKISHLPGVVSAKSINTNMLQWLLYRKSYVTFNVLKCFLFSPLENKRSRRSKTLADTADKEAFNLACSNSWTEAWGIQCRHVKVPLVCNSLCLQQGWLYLCGNAASVWLNGVWVRKTLAMLLPQSVLWVHVVTCDPACIFDV